MDKKIVYKTSKELWIWRIIAITTAIMLICKPNKNEYFLKQDCIVKTKLYDIYSDDKMLEKIEYLQDSQYVKAVLLQIDSGGGPATASEAIYKAFKELKSKKPLIVTVQNAAASGGYMVALAGHKIFAYETSAIGSIGVVMPSMDITELAERIGIKFTRYKSSPLKDLPNMFEKPTQEGSKSLQLLVDDISLIFKDFVRINRPNIQDIDIVCNANIFTGRKALEVGLIDAIGTEKDAMNALKSEYHLDEALPVINFELYSNESNNEGLFNNLKKFLSWTMKFMN